MQDTVAVTLHIVAGRAGRFIENPATAGNCARGIRCQLTLAGHQFAAEMLCWANRCTALSALMSGCRFGGIHETTP